uniref:Uncharacterized protein n=1 Tax=Mucochytrium quahogii TaxID=96639 RepID=A0A7S2RPZ3_9STRA|mmetsp:Transcript_23655/g.37759  ORF Transcript_23655/g.37759 Transcript_23655/m.37759 type:complete len:1026 (-) Transcript_23655:27-3104(-)
MKSDDEGQDVNTTASAENTNEGYDENIKSPMENVSEGQDENIKPDSEGQHEKVKTKEELKLESATVKIQAKLRAIFTMKHTLKKLSWGFKEKRLKLIGGILNTLSHRTDNSKIEGYEQLIRAISSDITYQDVCNEALTSESLCGIQLDLSSDNRNVRILAARFLCDFAHRHHGNSRLLCNMNGFTVGNVRVFAVSKKFQKQFHLWCKAQGTSPEGLSLKTFLAGIVQGTHSFHSRLHIPRAVERTNVRSSVYSYPKANYYDELDPRKTIIGVIIPDMPNITMREHERVQLGILKKIFERAAHEHGDAETLLNTLVPSVPMYVLLFTVKQNLDSIPFEFREYSKDPENIIKACGIKDSNVRKTLENRFRQAGDFWGKSALQLAARIGMNILWEQLASGYSQFVIENSLRRSWGNQVFHELEQVFQVIKSTEVSVPGPYVRRISLVNKLKECTSSALLVPELYWKLLGPLTDEDTTLSKELSHYARGVCKGFGLRNFVRGLEINNSRQYVKARWGNGICNWDWISWTEVLCKCREVVEPHCERELSLCPREAYAFSRTSTSHTNRRVCTLQRMLHSTDPGDRQAYIQKRAIQEELLVLCKAIACVSPSLTPIDIGIKLAPKRAPAIPKESESKVLAEKKEHGRTPIIRGLVSESVKKSQGASLSKVENANKRHKALHLAQIEASGKRRCEHEKRLRAIKKHQEEAERRAEQLQQKMHLKWAQEKIELDIRKKAQLHSRCSIIKNGIVHRHFRDKPLRRPTSSYQIRRSVETGEVTPAQQRSRMKSFDSVLRIRNRLALRGEKEVFDDNTCPGDEQIDEQDSDDERVNRDESIEKLIQVSTPMLALNAVKGAARSRPHSAKVRRPLRITKPKALDRIIREDYTAHGKKEVEYYKVGGCFMESKDVQRVTKRFYESEVAKLCRKFEKSKMSSRTSAIVAQHLYAKRIVEARMGGELDREVKLDILAELQVDNVLKPLKRFVGNREDSDDEDPFLDDTKPKPTPPTSPPKDVRVSVAVKNRRLVRGTEGK